MALLWIDSFDNYGTSTGNAPSPTGIIGRKYVTSQESILTIDSGQTIGYSLKLNTGTARLQTPVFNTTNKTLFVGFNFKLSGVSSNDVLFLFTNQSLVQTSFQGVNVRNRTGGELAIYRTGTQIGVTSGLGLTANTWHYLETKCYCDNSGAFELKLDGASILTGNADTQEGSVAYYNYITFLSPGVVDMHMDDLYICDGAGSINNDFLGKRKVVTLRPNGDDTTNWSISSGGNHYGGLDEEIEDDDTSYIETGTSNHKDLFNYENTSETTILGAMLTTDAKLTSTQGYALKHVVNSNGNELISSNQYVGEGYNSLSEIFEQDHDASANWTQSTINSAKFGVQVG
jgi:hypothetical protein